MLRRLYAGLFVAAVTAFLVTPALVQIVLPHPIVPSENRRFASWPAAPRSLAAALGLPSRIDAYVNDHFGLRYQMIAAHNRLQHRLFGEMPTRQVIEGHHGRLFLASHSASKPFELIRAVCGIGVDEGEVVSAAAAAADFIGHLHEVAPRAVLLIVPTSPIIYPEDLPDWIGRQCVAATPPALKVADRLPATARAAWSYPLTEEQRLKRSMPVFPRKDFHWLGTAPRAVVESLAEQRLGLIKRVDVPATVRPVASDLGQFLLGLWFGGHAALPDWRRAGIDACNGAKCFPELGQVAQILDDVSRYRAKASGNTRLLVLSDSFGLAAAGYFSQYAGTVWHFSLNNISRLSPAQREGFERFAFGQFHPDIVVAIFHDGALLGGLKRLNPILWPNARLIQSTRRNVQ